MKKVKSNLPFSYITIKTTKSRIEKGLLAVPVSLIDMFPKVNKKIYLLNEKGELEAKSFTAYDSSSHECRIGGLRAFYDNYQILDGEELVIQLLGDDKFRIIPERLFTNIINRRISDFEISKSDNDMDTILSGISKIANLSKIDILKNEFVKLSVKKMEDRKRINRNTTVREGVPDFIRKILFHLYEGKCQLTGFTFLMQNNKPYFEIHHIDHKKGNHVKNLLVVSPNVHAQFTYANIEQYFDNEGWLRKVRFNQKEYNVFQIIDMLPKEFEKEIHF